MNFALRDPVDPRAILGRDRFFSRALWPLSTEFRNGALQNFFPKRRRLSPSSKRALTRSRRLPRNLREPTVTRGN